MDTEKALFEGLTPEQIGSFFKRMKQLGFKVVFTAKPEAFPSMCIGNSFDGKQETPSRSENRRKLQFSISSFTLETVQLAKRTLSREPRASPLTKVHHFSSTGMVDRGRGNFNLPVP